VEKKEKEKNVLWWKKDDGKMPLSYQGLDLHNSADKNPCCIIVPCITACTGYHHPLPLLI
jgi:hypothetical protein